MTPQSRPCSRSPGGARAERVYRRREAARQLITDFCNTLQEQAFSDAGKLLNAVRFYKSQKSNTMKNSRSPETSEVLDELKSVRPLELSLDPEAYFRVPVIK